MKHRIISITTHVNKRNERFTKGALESAADLSNSKKDAVKFGLEHNNTIPPLGQVLPNAKVELRPDGEYQLLQEGLEYDSINRIGTFDNTELLRSTSSEEKLLPFAKNPPHENLKFSFDRINFGIEEFENLSNEITSDGFDFQEKLRYQEIPLPEIIVSLPAYIALYLFGKPFLNKFGEKSGEISAAALTAATKKISTIISKFIENSFPKKGKKYILLSYSGVIQIEFAIEIEKASDIFLTLDENCFENEIEKAIKLNDKYDVSHIQFYSSNGSSWELSYMLCKDGSIIGSKKAFLRRDKIIKELNKKIEAKTIQRFRRKMRQKRNRT